MWRVEPEEVDGLPKIPSQPIGYDDARILLEKMGGLNSPESWRGGMVDIDYKVEVLIQIMKHRIPKINWIHVKRLSQ